MLSSGTVKEAPSALPSYSTELVCIMVSCMFWLSMVTDTSPTACTSRE